LLNFDRLRRMRQVLTNATYTGGLTSQSTQR
jgi:hypothetical protein